VGNLNNRLVTRSRVPSRKHWMRFFSFGTHSSSSRFSLRAYFYFCHVKVLHWSALFSGFSWKEIKFIAVEKMKPLQARNSDVIKRNGTLLRCAYINKSSYRRNTGIISEFFAVFSLTDVLHALELIHNRICLSWNVKLAGFEEVISKDDFSSDFDCEKKKIFFPWMYCSERKLLAKKWLLSRASILSCLPGKRTEKQKKIEFKN